MQNFCSASSKQQKSRLSSESSNYHKFFPSFIRQYREFKNGTIGSIELLEASFISNIDHGEDDVNTSFKPLEALSHVVTLMRCFVKNVDEVHAFGQVTARSQAKGLNAFDIFVVNVTSRKGQVAKLTIHCSEQWHAAEPVMKCTLYGTKGTSTATYPEMVYTQDIGNGPERKDLLNSENAEYYFNREKKMGIPYGCYANYLGHYAKSIASQQNSYQVNIAQGLQTYVILEAIQRSCTQGVPIKIRDLKNEIYGSSSDE